MISCKKIGVSLRLPAVLVMRMNSPLPVSPVRTSDFCVDLQGHVVDVLERARTGGEASSAACLASWKARSSSRWASEKA